MVRAHAGSRARLGILWFAVSIGAALTSTLLLAVVMAAAAGLAADELLRHHAGTRRRLLEEPGRLVAVLAPLGPPLGSVLVGDGATSARFTRRLDSLLLAGPVAAYAVAALVTAR